MTDVTWCTSADCPSQDCKISIRKCKEKGLISMADFSGECRYYAGWVLSEIEKVEHDELFQ